MHLDRSDFLKSFGAGLAALLLARCQPTGSSPIPAKATETPVPPTCYEPTMPPPATPTLISLSPRERLRLCWLRFPELAEKTTSGQNQASRSDEAPLNQQMLSEHRQMLDELITAGEIEAPVADLIHEAYQAAVYHVWRSNALITCYDMATPNYAPVSAGQLVQQTKILAEMAEAGNLDPATVVLARQAIRRDLAFEALSDEEVQALYQRIRQSYELANLPELDQVELAITPEVEAAAAFLIRLLTSSHD